MIDLFSIAVTHGLLALAAWRLVLRADLDSDPARCDPDAETEAEAEPRPVRGRLRLRD